MTITTKFNIGDKAWILLGRDWAAEPTEVTIERIHGLVDTGHFKTPNIVCSFRRFPKDEKMEEIHESYFFKTKEELIEHLAKK